MGPGRAGTHADGPSYSGAVSAYRTLEGLSLSRGTLDRSALDREDQTLMKRVLADAGTRVVDLHEGRFRTTRVDGRMRLVLRAPAVADDSRLALFLGRDPEGTAFVAVVREEPELSRPGPAGRDWHTLREVGAELDDTEAGLVTTAVSLLNWHSRHPRCPRCGGPTEAVHGGWVRRCTQDGSQHHPRTDTAVIVAVTDEDDRLLLARGPRWPEGRMSVLAGFVEAGESLEATVAREVYEEVSVRVADVVYRGNQPWPFPGSLMIGFTARALDSDLVPDATEIVEAAWFTRGELAGATRSGEVVLPPRVSIARRLIEDWYGGEIEAATESTGPFRGADAS